MTVLSLFDGMACGRLALSKANIKVDKYYASEIDKYAIKVATSNFPDIIELGDINNIDVTKLEKIDLLIGGSPCQGFSFAGKQLNFNDPRSRLFFVYVNILNKLKKINPNIKFLLENVKMKKEYQDIISKELGVEPIIINSSLVSAQNRVRLYWTNSTTPIPQPIDKKILLKDIVEKNVGEKYFLSEEAIQRLVRHSNKAISRTDMPDKSGTIHAGYFKGGGRDQQYIDEVLCAASRGRYLIDGIRQDSKMKTAGLTSQRLELRSDSKTNCITGVQKDNILIVNEATKKGYAEILPNEGVDLTFPQSKTRRGRRMKDKSNCLTAANHNYCWYNGKVLRMLTPIECERLQTVPDNYTIEVSDSQRYKMLGNGWTIEVIVHIFKNLT